MPFQPGNRRQCVFPPRAIQYFVKAGTGTVNLNRRFDPIGQLLATVPDGSAIVTARLLPPAGPKALGNPARAALTVTATDGVTAATADVLLVEV